MYTRLIKTRLPRCIFSLARFVSATIEQRTAALPPFFLWFSSRRYFHRASETRVALDVEISSRWQSVARCHRIDISHAPVSINRPLRDPWKLRVIGTNYDRERSRMTRALWSFIATTSRSSAWPTTRERLYEARIRGRETTWHNHVPAIFVLTLLTECGLFFPRNIWGNISTHT